MIKSRRKRDAVEMKAIREAREIAKLETDKKFGPFEQSRGKDVGARMEWFKNRTLELTIKELGYNPWLRIGVGST